VVQHLPNKHQALSSRPQHCKETKKEEAESWGDVPPCTQRPVPSEPAAQGHSIPGSWTVLHVGSPGVSTGLSL
jgi:hypothetical protein